MNGEESPATRRPEPMGGVPKLRQRRATESSAFLFGCPERERGERHFETFTNFSKPIMFS